MPRVFDVPHFYRSPNISLIKRFRQLQDPRKNDLSPSTIDFGSVQFRLGRHFGFCFGVENAIEIAYRAIEENPTKRIFLLSEMIHNPEVNKNLLERGVQFLMETDGTPRIAFSELRSDDIVIVPAFGTTVELQETLITLGIDPYYYDTTCPFVEKVWKRSAELGKNGFAVIVHGKKTHEETRATFSHSKRSAPTLVILDMNEAEHVIDFMFGRTTLEEFKNRFKDSMSDDFDPEKHLKRLGVVNQTTMLASDTHAISQKIRDALVELYGLDKIQEHFADTRDTLCYATYENQTATRRLIESGADLAIVVGGYNSSNTSHLVELCELAMPTYYIRDHTEILSPEKIRHFSLHKKELIVTSPWLPKKSNDLPTFIALTSGASCPDSTVDLVLQRVVSFFSNALPYDQALRPFARAEETSLNPLR